MNASFESVPSIQPTLPFSHCPGLFENEAPVVEQPAACVSKSGLQLVPSVVSDAGLGHFVYLRGRSGKRYVFSSINPDQVGLYEAALFAIADFDGVRITQSAREAALCTERLYVHLPEAGDVAEIVADLNSPN